MKIIKNKNKLIKLIHKEKNLGFVPTMGAIHLGHISLIKKALKQCQKTIVTIFVNKPQFHNTSDFKSYPRLFNRDILFLRRVGVNYLYLPKDNEIYPKGFNKKIKISSFKKKLCGKYRPGHFEAVVDVIDRFIKIIKPKKIYFGEKDMQQLKIIKDFIKKNNINTEIIACKTVREKNGIALSSRNYLLTNNQKIIASKIYKLISRKKKYLIKNKNQLNQLRKDISNFGVKKIDYIEVLNINKILKPFKKIKRYRIFIAYYLGSVRLIDNI